MAKTLKQDPINKDDIKDYLAKYSDFAFEIKTLSLLTSIECKCKHAGTYHDPITNKIREYDIRAQISKKISSGLTFNLLLAIECKNMKENYPLLVHCMPRAKHEAMEEMVFCYHNEVEELLSAKDNEYFYFATTIPFSRGLSLYTKDDPVGKSCDQIGRSSGNDIVGSDSNVFEKISQALNSSDDLIKEAASFNSFTKYSVSIIKPVLVVPDKSLWQIIYDSKGNIKTDPKQVEYVPYYCGKSWPYAESDGKLHEYTLSHLDIVTSSYLSDHIKSVLKFENEDLFEHLQRQQKAGLMSQEIKL